jgi:hypothetical protein
LSTSPQTRDLIEFFVPYIVQGLNEPEASDEVRDNVRESVKMKDEGPQFIFGILIKK